MRAGYVGCETWDTSGVEDVLLSTTYYFYNDVGNPTRVVTETDVPAPAQPEYSATLMNYGGNGQAVTHVMGETWNNDGSGIGEYTQTYRREFRYDGARQRYMDAALNEVLAVIETQTDWTDYDGDTAYATFGFDATNQLVRRESWEPGLARVQQPSSPIATADYFHADHLGTTRHMSVGEGDVFEPAAYTAFGEKVSGVDFHRFGYAGAWGYQANPGFPFLHVGARYYDPASGRFLQRDPIGIGGGMNVYLYAHGLPTVLIDPFGLDTKCPCGGKKGRDERQAVRGMHGLKEGGLGCALATFFNKRGLHLEDCPNHPDYVPPYEPLVPNSPVPPPPTPPAPDDDLVGPPAPPRPMI